MNHPEILRVTFHPSGITESFTFGNFLSSRYTQDRFRIVLNVIFASDPAFPMKEPKRKNRTSVSRRSDDIRFGLRQQNTSAMRRCRAKAVAIRFCTFFLPVARTTEQIRLSGWSSRSPCIFHPRVSSRSSIPSGMEERDI